MTIQSLQQNQPEFDSGLSPAERKLILEELSILETVKEQFQDQPNPDSPPELEKDILALRDSLNDANRDDIAQIVTQMDNLANLSARLKAEGQEKPLNKATPYFGHLRVTQEGRKMDVLIGAGTMISRESSYPIIDWRNAPISKLYYSYREGDEYEEEFAGKDVEGVVQAHRRLMILKGQLLRIDCMQGIYQVSKNLWKKIDQAPPRLEGSEGSVLRPGNMGKLRLGVSNDAVIQEDKHLQAITGLIDPTQFGLITQPDSGIVIIDGGAGSGKTTIALHRIAYLAFNAPERFKPERMLAVIFNKALATYISRLLPDLGIEGVRIEVFEAFASNLRRRHFPALVCRYCENTPFSVMRFKHHPAALAMLRELVNRRTVEFRDNVEQVLEKTESLELALRGWDSMADLPLAGRIMEFSRWVSGKVILPGVGGFGNDWLATKRIELVIEDEFPEPGNSASLVINVWEEAFLRLENLQDAMERLAPGEFTTTQLAEVRDWCQRSYSQREEYLVWRNERREKQGGEDGEEGRKVEEPQLDREDDTLLLLLQMELIGPLLSRRKRPLKFAHLMIDEAQDFSPLELRLLVNLAEGSRSITLAGDTDQRMILHNSFNTWEEVLLNLGLESTSVSPLEVGYRSTEEIMNFSKKVLGDLSTGRKWIPTRRGAPVELLRFTDPGQAVSVLSDVLIELLRREPSAYTALITRYPAQADVYYLGLKQTDIPRLRRVSEQDFSFQPGIEVTDITQVKGLEFDYVILLDVDYQSYPDDTASRYLLHIGGTRAAHQLWLVACRSPSKLLPANLKPQIL